VSLALDAGSLIDQLAAINQDAVQLATLVSLASRIEPELLRTLRLEMLPSTDASAEADLWLSALMSSRSALFAVMRPAVADTLREQLGSDPQRLHATWGVLSHIHVNAPAALRTAEEITWRVLADPDDPEISRLFDSVVLAIESGRSGLAKWAARALPRLPAQARQSGGAWRVAQKASEILGGQPILAAELTSSRPVSIASSLPINDLPKVSVGLRLFENALRISEPPEDRSEHIQVPRTTPLLLELEWVQGGDKVERRTATFGPVSTCMVHPIDSGTLRITTAARDVYTVHLLAEHWERQEYTNVAVQDGFAVRLYKGDAAVLIALDAQKSRTNDIARFEILRQAPGQNNAEPVNRPFEKGAALPPIQRFRWIDRLPDNTVGQCKYEVSALQSDANASIRTTTVRTAIDVTPQLGAIEIGFTRGPFQVGPQAALKPGRGAFDFDTGTYAQRYQLLGGSAYRLMMDFISECLNDPKSGLDVMAFDFDHPDILKSFEAIGKRLRIVLDDSPAHSNRQFDLEARLKNAGCAVFRTHFKRFSHSKLLIQSVNGEPSSVLTGSTNFSINSLFAQHNHVLVIRDRQLGSVYEGYFQKACEGSRHVAPWDRWTSIEHPGLPTMRVLICPSKELQPIVRDAVQRAKRSILYSLGDASKMILAEIEGRSTAQRVLIGGVVHTNSGQRVKWNGNDVLIRPDSQRRKMTGTVGGATTGNGKFVVVDFDQPDAVLYAGSATFSDHSDMSGDDVLEIRDPSIATQFAIEALQMIDHYRFRTLTEEFQKGAVPSQSDRSWLDPYYSPEDPLSWERKILANIDWPDESATSDRRPRTAEMEEDREVSEKKSTPTGRKTSTGRSTQASKKKSTATSKKSPRPRRKK